MSKFQFQPLIDRTDAKLRYAKVHLDELKSINVHGGDDFDRAHQESFLFHLSGVKEAFLVELNFYYGAGLSNDSISLGKLRNSLKNKGMSSPEVAEIYALENDKNNWLYLLKSMRDVSIHTTGVKRHYHLGGTNHGKVWLSEPYTQNTIEVHFVDIFESWLSNMDSLIQKLRASSMKYANL